MLLWIVVLVALAAGTGLVGFVDVRSEAAAPAQTAFAIVLVLIVVSIAVAALRRR